MKACSTDFTWVTFISLSLLLLSLEALTASKQFQATAYDIMNNSTSICHDRFMSVYVPKVQYADLPFTIYVQDEDRGYYQAVAVAKQCHYFLGETETFFILTVASRGCFVRKQKNMTHVTVVIMARAHRGRVEIIKSIRLSCEWKVKEADKNDSPLVPRHHFCNKDGFNITIPHNATVPPLNLDVIWIPSGQGHGCKAQKRSKDAVTFSFPFTDCGTQSMISGGIITYWVNIEVKQHPQRGSVFRDTPFHLTVQCSFALAQITHLGIEVQGEKSLSTLKSKGLLRTEMRFAKDSSFRSFYSSGDPPAVTELGQPVYVEVFVLKHEDEDLTLLLEDCWATPTENPHDPQRWNLLVKGCPFSGDSHRTIVLPVVPSKELKYPSLHQWFVVKLFSFVKPATFENLVYFHCEIEICKGPDCSQSCSNGRRKLRRITPGPGQRILYSVVSGGPLLYLLETTRKRTALKSYLEATVHDL
ncbi:zona pellucida sperm-binding protein 4-like isoform X2 [Chelmon rostratus]|uniref:zona pellucida sperm-binding protein 4-like isoform X2 n=1 Tax=Chelmon rostratus TaxID=109905 RepID=UPI001BE9F271|nr:zona pellucida sperm-binding protein 4-like isoform X2 [Chelmon rostratus]